MKPKGLRLLGLDGTNVELSQTEDDNHPNAAFIRANDLGSWFDADQLDKLAQRCKEWSKYLRSQKGKKPVVKKWEDL